MTVDIEHIPKTATITIIAKDREIDNLEEQIEMTVSFIRTSGGILKEKNIPSLINLLVEIRNQLKTE